MELVQVSGAVLGMTNAPAGANTARHLGKLAGAFLGATALAAVATAPARADTVKIAILGVGITKS